MKGPPGLREPNVGSLPVRRPGAYWDGKDRELLRAKVTKRTSQRTASVTSTPRGIPGYRQRAETLTALERLAAENGLHHRCLSMPHMHSWRVLW